MEMNLGSHYFMQGGFTVNRGLTQSYDQWLFSIGYRFDLEGARLNEVAPCVQYLRRQTPRARHPAVCHQPHFPWGETNSLQEMIGRANDQVAKFVEKFSDVKCTEHVTQEKFKADGKVELKAESTYDYLVILTNAGGEISLDESRLAVKESKKEPKKGVSMLVSNGFATLFLVFHPYYSSGFEFTDLGEDEIGGRKFHKVQFKHISGMRSPAALSLRGREYPLDLAGVAWIDPRPESLVKLMQACEQHGRHRTEIHALRGSVSAGAFYRCQGCVLVPRSSQCRSRDPAPALAQYS